MSGLTISTPGTTGAAMTLTKDNTMTINTQATIQMGSITLTEDKFAKLTTAQVVAVRQRYDAGENTQQQLAAEFGVTQRVISLIVRRESYKDI
jgi:hypothetical protein